MEEYLKDDKSEDEEQANEDQKYRLHIEKRTVLGLASFEAIGAIACKDSQTQGQANNGPDNLDDVYQDNRPVHKSVSTCFHHHSLTPLLHGKLAQNIPSFREAKANRGNRYADRTEYDIELEPLVYRLVAHLVLVPEALVELHLNELDGLIGATQHVKVLEDRQEDGQYDGVDHVPVLYKGLAVHSRELKALAVLDSQVRDSIVPPPIETLEEAGLPSSGDGLNLFLTRLAHPRDDEGILLLNMF